MVSSHYPTFQLQLKDKQIPLTEESISELLGVLPYEIILILHDSYPEGKFFKDIKKDIEERLQDFLTKKNKNNSFTDQAIYYQLRKLKDLGFIETTSTKDLDPNDRLITSQLYRLTSLKFVIDFSDKTVSRENELTQSAHTRNTIPTFLQSFNHDTKFSGLIVLGEQSKDAPFLGPLMYLLNQYFDLLDLSRKIMYDKTILEDSRNRNNTLYLSQNLILIGGPNANAVFNSTIPNEAITLHEILPVKFLHFPDSGIFIRDKNQLVLSKDQSIGVIQLVPNPWNPNTKILTIGGARREGTEAIVNELTRSFTKIAELLDKNQYCLIEAKTDQNHHLIDSKILE